MVSITTLKKRRTGFTLVELLIVVAIIGVLSTIGVPTFRRMVQKSKKSEAKVNLGGLYTAEQSFYSEYGGFGTNLSGIGFTMDGSAFLYTVGFPNATCADSFNAADSVRPKRANGVGGNINNVNPNYYVVTGSPSIAGRPPGNVCNLASIEDNGANFTATATGCIGPGCTANSALATAAGNCSSTNACQDAWTITDQRVMANSNDGVY